MRGIPQSFNTQQDWLNTHQYVLSKGDAQLKALFKARLEALKSSGTVLVLKKDAPVNAEEQSPEDFESVPDPGSSLASSGLSIAEIDLLISQIS